MSPILYRFISETWHFANWLFALLLRLFHIFNGSFFLCLTLIYAGSLASSYLGEWDVFHLYSEYVAQYPFFPSADAINPGYYAVSAAAFVSLVFYDKQKLKSEFSLSVPDVQNSLIDFSKDAIKVDLIAGDASFIEEPGKLWFLKWIYKRSQVTQFTEIRKKQKSVRLLCSRDLSNPDSVFAALGDPSAARVMPKASNPETEYLSLLRGRIKETTDGLDCCLYTTRRGRYRFDSLARPLARRIKFDFNHVFETSKSALISHVAIDIDLLFDTPPTHGKSDLSGGSATLKPRQKLIELVPMLHAAGYRIEVFGNASTSAYNAAAPKAVKLCIARVHLAEAGDAQAQSQVFLEKVTSADGFKSFAYLFVFNGAAGLSSVPEKKLFGVSISDRPNQEAMKNDLVNKLRDRGVIINV